MQTITAWCVSSILLTWIAFVATLGLSAAIAVVQLRSGRRVDSGKASGCVADRSNADYQAKRPAGYVGDLNGRLLYGSASEYSPLRCTRNSATLS
jgi:hypothetical protein